MSNNLYTFLAIISAALGMIICRMLPYIIFANGKLPKIVKFYEKYLQAYILEENIASKKIFKNLGFIYNDEKKICNDGLEYLVYRKIVRY